MNEKIIKTNNTEYITNIGIALSLIGVPLGMYFSHLFPFIKWSNLFMVLSFLFISSFKNIFIGSFPSFNKTFLYILLFQFLMLFYGILSENLSFQYLSFHLYIIFLVIAFSSKDNNISFSNLIPTIFIISGICSFLGFYFLITGLVTSDETWELRQSENFALEVFTISIGAIINFASSIFLITKKGKYRIIALLLISIDILIIFMATKRTPVFVALMIFIIYLLKMGSFNKIMFLKYIKYFFISLIILFSLYFISDIAKDNIDNFVNNFYNGVLNILGDTKVTDTSGSGFYRYKLRLWTYYYIENEFNLLNYLFGGGYMLKWIDNPVLQSYLDMGIIGFILYFSIVVIFPIRSFFSLKNNLALFAILICLYNIFSAFSSGNPYLYIKYVPVVFLAFTMNLRIKKI